MFEDLGGNDLNSRAKLVVVTFFFLAFITVHLLNSPEGSMFVLQFVTETFMLNIDMLWISNMVEQGYLAVLR